MTVLEVEVDGVVHRVALERRAEGSVIHMDGQTIPVDVCEPMPGVLSLLIGNSGIGDSGTGDGGGENGAGGRAYRCVRTVFADEESIAVAGRQHRVVVADPRSLRGRRKGPGAGNGTLHIKASMPGRVARVLVAPGEAVVAGQGVVVIEAMKMQNELKAARDGRVAEVRVAAGDTVASGQVLAVIE
ncbi:MAG TPA: acetyl-CoA carboxylase biotin carboxyl carrier protein subunit [Acidobacteriaceae bacterium]|jgi:biotin carboxyl carrier protein